jgi:hypothetical protein
MRTGKGNLTVGFRCKLSARGGSAVHLALVFVGGKVRSDPPRRVRSAQNDNMAGEAQERELFLHEQCGNVVENKGPLWKSCAEAGMLLITKEISAASWNVIENKGGNRYEKG